jgi:hypothetical protein
MGLKPEGIGTNQLNILLFEVGFKKRIRDPFTGTVAAEKTFFVGVHPLLVAPTRIQLDDASRTPVLQTTGGSLATVSGRALRTVSLDGSFGVEERGLLTYLGTGEIRFKRFYSEVVRMSDCLFNEDLDNLVNALGLPTALSAIVGFLSGSSPGIQLLVSQFDEADSTFYVNFYDFWNNLAFQCQIRQFTAWREHRNGGASGLVHYRMVLQEVGPLVTGTLATTIISGILAGMTLWSGVNGAIETYTIGNILQSFVNTAGSFMTLWDNTKDAFEAQAQSVRDLMGGFSTAYSAAAYKGNEVSGTSTATTTSSTSSATLSAGAAATATLEAQQAVASFFATAESLAAEASSVALDLSQQTSSFDSETGIIDWADQLGEGGSRDLSRYDEERLLLDFEEAARWQSCAGVVFGMSRSAYRAYVEAGGCSSQSAPEIAGSRPHVVSDSDTPASIESLYGVTWDKILAANRMTPDEALFAGTVLAIPTLRQRGEPGIAGLPTFGSHIGRAAWGVDLDAELDVGSDGDLSMLSDEDLLSQGCEYLVDCFGPSILKACQEVPSQVRANFVAKQFRRIFVTDERIESVEEVAADVRDAAIDVQVRLRAINGSTSIILGV